MTCQLNAYFRSKNMVKILLSNEYYLTLNYELLIG